MGIARKTLTTWKQIQDFDRRGWIYRGQPGAKLKLKTSMERLFEREKIPFNQRKALELELLRDFKRAFHQYSPNVPSKGSTLEWLALMQHHGAPTRFLDWTYSIYIAAYFALETAEADCAVWAVNAPWAMRQSQEALRRAKKGGAEYLEQLPDEKREANIRPILFDSPAVRFATPLNAFRLNERLRIQKGIFLVPGDGARSFMENLEALPGYDSSKNVFKLEIPLKMRRAALTALYYMNIARTSLFPGLDGYARSLGVYHSSFEPLNWAKIK